MRMRVHDTGLGFLCAHMSSGESEGDDEKRNHDHHEILRRAQFPQDTDVDADVFASAGIAAVNQACLAMQCNADHADRWHPAGSLSGQH